MAEIDINKEAEKFINELKSSKIKVETSKNFELDYMRQYAKSDREFVLAVLRRSGLQNKD